MPVKGSAKKRKSDVSVEVDGFIRGGGSHADSEAQEEEVKPMRVNFYLPSDLVETVDEARKTRAVSISRNKWVQEAIIEKLEREK